MQAPSGWEHSLGLECWLVVAQTSGPAGAM
jgi:hypothetical protein